MLYNILLIVQIVVSVSIIGLVLIQHGKGADAGAAFGSGASGTVFGSRGSGNFLSRMTGVLATIFFANSLGLAWIVAHQPETTSLIDTIAAPTEQVSTPATTATEETNADSKPAEDDDAIPADAEPASADTSSEQTSTDETSPADEIPADDGDAAKTAPAPEDKSSDIPE